MCVVNSFNVNFTLTAKWKVRHVTSRRLIKADLHLYLWYWTRCDIRLSFIALQISCSITHMNMLSCCTQWHLVFSCSSIIRIKFKRKLCWSGSITSTNWSGSINPQTEVTVLHPQTEVAVLLSTNWSGSITSTNWSGSITFHNPKWQYYFPQTEVAVLLSTNWSGGITFHNQHWDVRYVCSGMLLSVDWQIVLDVGRTLVTSPSWSPSPRKLDWLQ
jgi:hypothetical protein